MMPTSEIPDRDGFQIVCELDYDQDASTDDDEGLDSDDLERYAKGDAYFVQYRVTASLGGHVLGTAWIGGCDVGDLGPDNYIHADDLATGAIAYYLDDLIEDAIAEARVEAARLSALFTEVSA